MIVIEPYATIIGMSDPTGEGMLRHIERCARTCYKSEGGQTEDSYKKLLPQLMTSAHMSVFEHGSITVEFCIDRGVSHELVRHRMAAYSR